MFRLTQRKDDKVSVVADANTAKVVKMLAEYEDLELTPSEIEEMRLRLCDLEAIYENTEDAPAEEADKKAYSRADVLNAAMRCVCGDREQDYGSPECSFRMIAALWEPYIRQKCVTPGAELTISPSDVAALMCLFKIARIATGHGKVDNWVDCAGYAANGGEIETGGLL